MRGERVMAGVAAPVGREGAITAERGIAVTLAGIAVKGVVGRSALTGADATGIVAVARTVAALEVVPEAGRA